MTVAMFNFTKINYKGDNVGFFSFSRNKLLTESDRSMADVIPTGGPSEVAPSISGKYMIKMVTSRTFHERGKALWMHSRLNKEIRGNHLLQRVGVRVPDIKESGYHPFPPASKRFLGYYIMENLEKSGFYELEALLQQGGLRPEAGEAILNNIMIDIKKMAAHSIVYSDLHLGNILVNAAGDIAWIDTGVSHYHFGRGYKFERKYNDSIKRLLKQPQLRSLAAGACERVASLAIGQNKGDWKLEYCAHGGAA